MAKQIKIKDIAKMANVSAGTVDRILHNRGNVSAESREKVESVLAQVDYKFNIHTSAVSLKKSFRIVITIPSASIGEYWGSMQNGFEHAFEEFCDIDVDCSYSFYNQFDLYSCKSAFERVMAENPDAVIIGPTFIEPTLQLCRQLDEGKIPYVFVDSVIDGCNPVASFASDQYCSGGILARMLTVPIVGDGEVAIFKSQRVGNQKSFNSFERKRGFVDMIREIDREKGRNTTIHEEYFSILNTDENEDVFSEFLHKHPNINGIAVMNSRGHIVADLLESRGRKDVRVVCYDLTYNNKRGLRAGYIHALLCQRPEQQGFLAVKSIIGHLLYRKHEAVVHHKMPIDIVIKENLPYYRETE